MNIIKEVNNVFALVGEDIEYLIPGKMYVWDEDKAPLFIRRLRSTRGQRNSWWAADEKAREVLNQAPFCPMVRGYVRYFVWGGPNDVVIPYDVDLSMPCVRQGGSMEINFYAVFWKGLNDPVRDYLNLQTPGMPIATQGHLSVYRISEEPPEEVKAMLRPGNPCQPYRFFNHIVCYYRPLWRSIAGTACGLVNILGTTVILSEDHQNEPIVLNEPGWYLLEHPIPRPQQSVD
jgi:hypothetical protein